MIDSDFTPVLVGMATAMRRDDDFRQALEPLDLMVQVAHAAGIDSGSAEILGSLEHISVPAGRWKYANPAGEIARAVGAPKAFQVLSSVGVLQQTLIGDACARIARGEVRCAMVVGADTGYRLLRARISGEAPHERTQNDAPDLHLRPAQELRHTVELRSGMQMPVGLYAILESALRAREGLSVSDHRDRIAALYARFTDTAAANPHATLTQALSAIDIRNASARNPMQAFPYTRHHCSDWNVDQAGALLLCSNAHARSLGIPEDRWVYPVVSTESNHMVAVSARKHLAECPGARITGQAALAYAGLQITDVDLVDLYSCFPLAVQHFAKAVGLNIEAPLTLTGGMAFAGGPYNNYVLQSTCRAIELMRMGRGRNALLSCVSGVVTKQAFALWSMDPPQQPFASLDLSATVAKESPALEIVEHFRGMAVVAGCTVLHARDKESQGVVLADTPDGRRAMATTSDPAFVRALESEEMVGRRVHIEGAMLLPST
ncbi:hypothetical protein SNE35_26305 [Paucibacter sp. R3-3]|uniref:Thiolase-like protein type 1 additional C-terminal domain-containing protein n=1 Tax=Roseateles agri TaxID=3098619 RepID=A0ABU5DP01_9BURK|nr:hypothetical protein [Paucibacter sp. R3-3]MDY0748040.1 hypothetical protein [Paucibacter sp. R3-3]